MFQNIITPFLDPLITFKRKRTHKTTVLTIPFLASNQTSVAKQGCPNESHLEELLASKTWDQVS